MAGAPAGSDRHPASDPGDWLSYDGDSSGRRYRRLDQIHPGNVNRLAVRWVFQYPELPDRSPVSPLVRNGIMYLTVGGSDSFALDARTGRILWHSRYQYDPDWPARPFEYNRGFALSGRRLFRGTGDGNLIALDAGDGSLLWRSRVGDPELRQVPTPAPLVVKDLVIVGIRGNGSKKAEGRGYLDAYEAATGRRVWRFYTIPAAGEPGSETWSEDAARENGRAGTWTTGTYDPDLNLLYWTTGNPGPLEYDGSNRQGDNLYADSVVALNPDTGKLQWHYQFTPHDVYDWDASETPILVDMDWKGAPRKLLVQANRNAFFYVLDRGSGELLLGKPFAKQTWAAGMRSDGRPDRLPQALPSAQGTEICPDPFGGTNWQAQSYNPLTKLLYVMARDACARYHPSGPSFRGYSAEHALRAIDVQTGAVAWQIPQLGISVPNLAGTVTTSAGLVFFANHEGYLMAADGEKGDLLWHFNTGGSIRANPMTFAVAGKQYVSIASKGALFTFGLPD